MNKDQICEKIDETICILDKNDQNSVQFLEEIKKYCEEKIHSIHLKEKTIMYHNHAITFLKNNDLSNETNEELTNFINSISVVDYGYYYEKTRKYTSEELSLEINFTGTNISQSWKSYDDMSTYFDSEFSINDKHICDGNGYLVSAYHHNDATYDYDVKEANDKILTDEFNNLNFKYVTSDVFIEFLKHMFSYSLERFNDL